MSELLCLCCYNLLYFNFMEQASFKQKTKKTCAQRGARTHDPEIKSLMLYRLS